MKNKGIIGQFENRKSIDFNLILITILIKLNDLIMILIKLNDFNHDFNHFHIPFSSFLFYFFICGWNQNEKKEEKNRKYPNQEEKEKKISKSGKKSHDPITSSNSFIFFSFFSFFSFYNSFIA